MAAQAPMSSRSVPLYAVLILLVLFLASGMKSATGSCGGTVDGEEVEVSSLIAVLTLSEVASVNMVLYMSPSHRFSVGAIVTGFTITEAVADKVTFGFDFTAGSDVVYS